MKLARIVGWIVAPFVMVIVQWKALGRWMKVAGSAWAGTALVLWLTIIVAAAYTSPPQGRTVPAAAAGTTEHQTEPPQPTAAQLAAKAAAEAAARRRANARALLKKLEALPQLGQPKTFGGLKVTVDSLVERRSIGNSVVGATANGMFWLVRVSVENVGSSPTTVTDDQFTIETAPRTGAKVTTYSADSGDEMYLSNDPFPVLSLNPGVTGTGVIVFDMPTALDNDVHQYILNVSSGLFGPSQNFSLLKVPMGR
ncbi:MAG: DUF4352 domain-containing protein [Firmicutes bacterium]|nr:DUF4352 domain-containing protein [Bacillota bacterium]